MESTTDDPVAALLAEADRVDAIGRAQLLQDVQRRLFGSLSDPTVLDRYRIVRPIGSGGQGIVYEAYDPELDRRVAVKLLRADARAGTDDRRRLLREALALAQLSHPNVVAINDVGQHAIGIYIVTQLIDGSTLADWLKTPRSLAAILDVFVAAGRGLQAAHQRGIVHRDFKPANVLVGSDGRAMLVDFGLARETNVAVTSERDDGDTGPSSDPAVRMPAVGTNTLTRPGHVMGTPAYMAPEQHAGAVANAAADQYAFCVALYEALWQRRPFTGDGIEALAVAKREKIVPEPPRGDAVPRAIFRAIARGLAVDPTRRWPSMASLITALERGRNRSRRGLAVIVAVGIVAATMVAAQWLVRPHAAVACDDARAWTQTWSPARRQRLAAEFDATGIVSASDAAQRTSARIDAFGQAWLQTRERACAVLDTDRDADRRIACLDDRRDALAETLAVLEHPDAGMVTRAADMIAGLPDPRTCETRLDQAVPDAIAADVAALRQRIARGRALERAGRMQDALAVLAAADRDATILGHPPLRIEATIAHGTLLRATGNRGAAAERLEAAYFDAEAEGRPADAASAAREVAGVHGIGGDAQLGREWLRRAEASLARLGGDADPVERGLIEYTASDIAERAGDLDPALAHARRAFEILSAELPRDDARIGHAHRRLASTLAFMNRLDEAQAESERALAAYERSSGPDHPDMAYALSVLALVAKRRGDFAAALELQHRALAIREAASGKDDPSIASLLGQIAILHSETGQAAQAEASYRRALAIQRDRLGPDDPLVARTLHNLAITLRDRGRTDEAMAAWREAIAIGQRTLGAEHPEVAAYELAFALNLVNEQREEEALPLIEHALAVARATLDEGHPTVAERMAALAFVQRRLRQLDRARTTIDRALAIAEQAVGPDHSLVARIRYEHAQLLSAESRYEEALAEHERVLAAFERTLGAEHTAVAESLESIAELHDVLGRPQLAKAARLRGEAIAAAAAAEPPAPAPAAP